MLIGMCLCMGAGGVHRQIFQRLLFCFSVEREEKEIQIPSRGENGRVENYTFFSFL